VTTAETQAAPVIDASALSGVRFLVSKRIEDLEGAAAHDEADLLDATARVDQLHQQAVNLDTRWGTLLQELPGADPAQVDTLFRELATMRADLAAAEERHRELTARLNGAWAEREVLRSVYRSLDDVLTSTVPPAVGGAKLRSASRQVFQIIEEERMRIARDMHDGPAQSMANLVLQAEILERLITRDPRMVVSELADFKQSVRRVLDETRRLIFDLRPMTLDDLGLVPTLRKFVKEFGEHADVSAHLRVTGQEIRLPRALEPTIFRIIQEALNNSRKHARATTVEVVINFRPSLVTAMVRDDGVGMDVAATEAGLDSNKHLGLISMRERAELEKGTLDIRSEPGVCTEVTASFEL